VNQLPCFSEIVVDDPLLISAFHQLFSAMKVKTSSILEQQTYLLYFVSQLFFKHTHTQNQCIPPKPEPRAISQAREYVEAHCTESFSIHELAKIVNLNPYYLIRCFHQQVGLPPHSYKKHCQLLQAKQALLKGESLLAIALQFGFYDQSHFTRTFKQTFGLTPGQYQKVNFIQ